MSEAIWRYAESKTARNAELVSGDGARLRLGSFWSQRISAHQGETPFDQSMHLIRRG
jgi:hypothetical protein